MSNEQHNEDFKASIQKALNDQVMRGALSRFADAYPTARKNAYQGVDIEALRNEIACAKAKNGENLDQLIKLFTENATKRGAKVYFAKTAEDANRYIANLAIEKKVKKIVKSKSMASEEIHLNDHLKKAGLIVNETDLGEWIIQLAGQKPSHMVMPAIHLSKEQVAGYFSKELKSDIPPDIPLMVQKARAELRTKFIEADMGISGANFAVAETGTIATVTNEGNARLTTTLPRVHVALVGIEKVIKDFKEAANIIKALPKSATGQLITSYVTMVTGVTPTEVDGQVQDKELHIVLMDNGRSDMLKDPKFKQAWQCIRCASCLNVCPAYQMVGGHVYGHIYAGGIGAILTFFFNDPTDAEKPQNLCLGCGRCTEVCPGKIPIPDLILEMRRRMAEKKGIGLIPKAIFNVVANRKLMHSLLRVASVGQLPLTGGKPFIRHLPFFFSELTKERSLPAVAPKPFRDIAKEREKKNRGKKKRVNFYAGCLIDFCYPHIGTAVYDVLEQAGCEVYFPWEQACCGAPAKYMGDRDSQIRLAKQNVAAMEEGNPDYIVSACPTCTVALLEDVVEVLKDDPAWHDRAKKVAAKVRDFSALAEELGVKAPGKKKSLKGKFTYHDSCHYRRHLHLSDVPRKLLTEVAGMELVEMKDSDQCCGMAGSYLVKFPEISAPILQKKLDNIAATGSELVCVDCPGCVMQISGGLDKRRSSVKIRHTAEVLAEALRKG
ncbi:4fe-4S ferredoxin, iron-sulfur binding protein, putative [Heliomicrobium modesticaldum Ice1]|uniref:4fe-4S ferredoxin, iron-sulfur binding protein, putative n=1 Tax=Heliobacterium modesticaldum (strain ATCC 51547 / Ice1) TaxID=498761 RepID=B0TEZ9_HELMI|nr:LUD domain-containing protein [Heliomicrobium modesticaldum]ABZ82982.1 4fe-4S ferredoxin, iron-sulfur binding protein, putative [Heliomicrobium modesticaldum Ice1]